MISLFIPKITTMKSILRTFCVLLTVYLFPVSSIAQSGASVEDTDMLKQRKIVLMEDYPHIFKAAQIINVSELDQKHSVVSYTIAGNYYETVVNSDRKDLLLVATCKQIHLANIPDIVKDSFNRSESGSKDIVKAFEVTTPTSSVFYRLDAVVSETIKNDTHPKTGSFFFDELGHYMNPPY